MSNCPRLEKIAKSGHPAAETFFRRDKKITFLQVPVLRLSEGVPEPDAVAASPNDRRLHR
jgi:hypothetical protein